MALGFNSQLHGASNVLSRAGVNLTGSDSTELFLKKFAGEVMTVFDEKNIMKPLHTIRTISKGKSAQFPVIGTANAGYYTPGTDILSVNEDKNLADGASTTTGLGNGNAGLGQAGGLNHMQQTEVLIHIDKMLMSSTFISSIDELVSHFDVRAPYTHQLGEALANAFDRNVLRVAVKTGAKNGTGAALLPSDAWITDQTKRGSVVYCKKSTPSDPVNTANAGETLEDLLREAPKAEAIRNALFESARLLDEKDVPSSDRYAIITPAMYYELVNNSSNTDVVNSVINKDVGGEGSIAAGTVARVAGITLLTSMHIPKADETGVFNRWDGQTGNDYRQNTSKCAGLVFQKGGFATLKLQDLTMESEYLIARQGNLFVAKYSMGHGPLRPESVVVWSDSVQPS